MIPDDARTLLVLAGDVGYPRVRLGRIVVHGEAAWKHAIAGIPGAIPRERDELLRGLEKPLLVSTEGGRARVRRWLDARRATPGPPMSAVQRRAHIAEHAVAFGDESMHGPLISALMRLPEYVRDTALTEAAFFLVGARIRGWCGTGTLPPDRVGIMIAGGDDVERTAVHECAHLFLGDLATARHPMVPVWNRACALAVARAERWPVLEHVEQRHARDERLAIALEQIWSR